MATEIQKNNDDVIKQQAAQDVSGQPTNGDSLDAGSALDALRAKVIEAKPAEAAPVEEPKVEGQPAAEPKVEATPKEEPAAAAPAPKADGTPAAAAPAVPAVDPAKVAEDERLKKEADKIFKDSPVLPANASPKSSEAFSSVKLTAAREISKISSELEDAKKKLAEAETKLKSPLPPELEQELTQLREFRAKLDIEGDPRFKKFDEKISASHEFIYAQLKRSPNITDDTIKKIKELGGPEHVNMDTILASVKDSTIQRLVESKLSDIEMTKHEKDQAISAAKSDIKKYTAQREQEWAQSANAHNTETQKNLNDLTSKVSWLNEVQVDPKADEAARKSAEAHNGFAKKMREEIQLASTDDSPAMRATLVLGMAHLFRLQAVHEATKAQLTTITKERDDAVALAERLKTASVSRLKDSGAPPSGTAPAKPAGPNFNESAAEAMDRLRKERAQSQQAA